MYWPSLLNGKIWEYLSGKVAWALYLPPLHILYPILLNSSGYVNGEQYRCFLVYWGLAWRARIISANIPTLSFHGLKSHSNLFQSPKDQLGAKFFREIPPDTRYLKGMVVLMLTICHPGNSLSNWALSLSNIIHGKAPFAPDSGPVRGNSQFVASGRKGSWWR